MVIFGQAVIFLVLVIDLLPLTFFFFASQVALSHGFRHKCGAARINFLFQLLALVLKRVLGLQKYVLRIFDGSLVQFKVLSEFFDIFEHLAFVALAHADDITEICVDSLLLHDLLTAKILTFDKQFLKSIVLFFHDLLNGLLLFNLSNQSKFLLLVSFDLLDKLDRIIDRHLVV